MKIKESIAAKKKQEQDEINNALECVNEFIRDCLPELIKVTTKAQFEAFKNVIVQEGEELTKRYRRGYYKSMRRIECKRSFSTKAFLKRFVETEISVIIPGDYKKYEAFAGNIQRYDRAISLLIQRKCKGFWRGYDSGTFVHTEEISLSDRRANWLGPRLRDLLYKEAAECAASDEFVIKQNKNGLIAVRYYL